MADGPYTRDRSVRSSLRAGRITAAQQRALAELWPRYGIHYTAAALDLAGLFGRDAPRTLEIGFGNGENLAALAAARPERDFLGVEVHRPGVGRLLLSLEARGLANVRIVCHDAVDVLEQQLAPARSRRFSSCSPIRGRRSATTSAA